VRKFEWMLPDNPPTSSKCPNGASLCLSVYHKGSHGKDSTKRNTWNPALLVYETIEASAERARERLTDKHGRIAELEAKGQERALVLKTLLLTGLRSGELRSITIGQLRLDEGMPYIELAARDEKNRDGSDLPLRGDLATDIREWLGHSLTPSTLPVDGTVDLIDDSPLFYVPTGLRRMLDRDLKAAGIPKRDNRGRTIDVHALRHSFGTMLSQNGVAPRTAQAAMRHSKIDLTMNVYTDPRLLDVSSALDALPTLKLDDECQESERVALSGTDNRSEKGASRKLPPGTAQSGYSESSAVSLAFRSTEDSEDEPIDVTSMPVNEKDPLSVADIGSLLRGE